MRLPSQPEANEPIARFLTSKSDFSAQQRRVRERAFLPHPALHECSVFRVESLETWEIFRLGREHVKVRRIYGYAEFAVRDATSLDLEVSPAEPPPRHANIIGWPRDRDPAMEEARQLLIAKELAMRATLRLEEDE